jgi:DNA-binding PadR family transcriptional regulator
LEGVCLGIVDKHKPCTAYRVRRELKNAPSSHWQASAGSVYPLLARLAAEGLVATTADEDDGRGRKLLRVTARGRASLKAWVVAGADAVHISSMTDPIRSRTFFLNVLGARNQSEYLTKLIGLMEDYLAETRTRLQQAEQSGDIYDYLGSLGAVKVTEARLEWLRIAQKRMR